MGSPEYRTTGVIITLILLLCLNAGHTTKLEVFPQNITIGGPNPTTSLKISCSRNDSGKTAVLALELGKMSFDDMHHPIVQLNVANLHVQLKDKELQQRMNYTGSINGASGSLEIVLTNPWCPDVPAKFYCSVAYVGNAVSTEVAYAKPRVRTYPDSVSMITHPLRMIFDANSMVEFTCQGRIGNNFDQNMADFWVWQWRLVGRPNSQWTRYPYAKNITYDTPQVDPSCGHQYDGRSSLFHTVTPLDNGRQFRCFVVSPVYVDNFTIYMENPPIIG